METDPFPAILCSDNEYSVITSDVLKSFDWIWHKKSRGPKTVHWGTPESTVTLLDDSIAPIFQNPSENSDFNNYSLGLVHRIFSFSLSLYCLALASSIGRCSFRKSKVKVEYWHGWIGHF